MKKLLTLISIILFISCESKPKIEYEEKILDTYNNGNKNEVEVYKIENGTKSLNKLRRYFNNGFVEVEYEVDFRGQQNGYYNEYRSDGKLKTFGNYVIIGSEVQKNGTWYYYDTNGNVIESRTEEYNNGVKVKKSIDDFNRNNTIYMNSKRIKVDEDNK